MRTFVSYGPVDVAAHLLHSLLFPELGPVYAPFDDLSDTISEQMLNVRNLLRRYEAYLQANRDWLLKNAPRRREPVGREWCIFEAVYHFNL